MGALADSEKQYWFCAELMLQKPWFLICSSREDNEKDASRFELTHALFAFCSDLIAEIVSLRARRGKKLRAVYVVTPSHINGTVDWQMDRLAAVWTAEEPTLPGQKVEVFETAKGARYGFSLVGTPLSKLKKPKLKMRLPVESADQPR